MADRESSGVAAAYREVNGLCAEALSLVKVADEQVDSPTGLEILMAACLQRLADAYEEYEFELRRVGVDVSGDHASMVLGGRSEAEGGGEAPLQSGSPN